MINVQCEVNAIEAGKQSYDVEHKELFNLNLERSLKYNILNIGGYVNFINS